MDTDFTIRSATHADLPILQRLASESATSAQWSPAQYEQLFQSGAAKRILLVLEDATAIQGFLMARTIADEWEIENIVVAAPAQRRGLGTLLLAKLLALAHDQHAETAFLEVRESNSAARRLYEKLGFAESGRRPHYYRDPDEDAVIYLLSLA